MPEIGQNVDIDESKILGLTLFSSSIFALMNEYIATPAIAMLVPIPVWVDILFPAMTLGQ